MKTVNLKPIRRCLYLFILFLFTTTASAAPDWSMLERLFSEQKDTQATLEIDKILTQAKHEKDNKTWQQALILGASARTSTGKFEEALHYLNQAWPQDNESKMLIYLHKAYLLSSYVQAYRWEIQNREKVSSKKAVPLKKKTMQQLVQGINQAFSKAYLLAVGQLLDVSLDDYTLPISTLKNYFFKANYPVQVRGSIRDTITYLWVDFLQDSSLWTAAESTQSNSFSLKELLAVSYRDKYGFSTKINSLKRQLWLLSNLEHYKNLVKKPEAAMEAFRVKIEKLSQLRNNPEDLKRLIKSLKQYIAKSDRKLPWINMLRNTLAQLILKTNADDANIKGVAILKQCLAQHPKHNATAFCRQQLNEITKPSVRLTAMKADGLKKRSLLIEHNNINKLYFRAWRISKSKFLQNRSYQLMNSFILENSRKPDAKWQIKITDKKDYKTHNTYSIPPLNKYGLWYIAASINADFSTKNKKNVIASTTLNLTRLVADIQIGATEKQLRKIGITVYNGETGHVASKVNVELWTQDAKLVASTLTSADGKAIFKVKEQKSYKLIIRHKQDFTVVENVYPYPMDHSVYIQKNALTFTDRAIYRPSQKILWKVIAYKGDQKTGKYNVFVNNSGWVKLFDANNKLVQQINVKTNRYGSASGEFIAKAGRILGNWRIETSWGGSDLIKVEEYKRPTFSVKINPSKKVLVLNKPAKIEGIAKYYFGQSITDGTVKWRVKRAAWSRWPYGGRGENKAETIATGVSKVDASGNFAINFVPKSSDPKQLKGLTDKPKQHTFTVTADFTDSGGETRTATRRFSVGKIGIEANIKAQQSFGVSGKSYPLSINRTDKDGIPREGNAHWELYQISQPGQAQMPADLPANRSIKTRSKFATKGDLMNPRWMRHYAIPSNLDQLTKNWKDGRRVQRGTLQHDKTGTAKLALNSLGAGLYRLRYTTKDEWGQPYKTEKTFVIAFQDKNTIRVPAVLEVLHSSVEVGGKVTYLAGSGFKESPVLLEIYHGNKLLKRSIQRGGIKQLEFPVTREHQGGLTFVLTLVKDYQLIRKRSIVSVPWSDRELNVSFSTFRDKLQPGQKEKWRISVKNAKNKPMEKGAVEILASMYDRSLDLFAPHTPRHISSLYRQQSLGLDWKSNLGISPQLYRKQYRVENSIKYYHGARLRLAGGGQQLQMAMPAVAMDSGVFSAAGSPRKPSPVSARRAPVTVRALQMKLKARSEYKGPSDGVVGAGTRAALIRFMNRGDEGDENVKIDNSAQLDSIKSRTNFNETAFFYPHLVLEEDGTVAFEFEVPESLTEWKVWVSAITKDLQGGSLTKLVKTSKALMVRPYLPRFLRAGDHAYIEVLVNNTSNKALTGKLDFDILDTSSLKSIAKSFKLTSTKRDFTVAAGKSSRQRFSIVAPKELGMVAIRARASAGTLGDGEQRPIPILPSRIHLTQSRFAALQGNMSRTLQFKELAQNNDPTRINDKLVVTVDGQLFYSTLNALPYLVQYPYECTEQTMNRFLSTSIINSVFKDHPAIATMATKLAKRDSQFEKWQQVDKDPNHKMLLEETPWLDAAQGGKQGMDNLIRILDPKIANTETQKALLKLRKAQTASGGFPWWDGGRESVYMTAYLLHGFSRALEFKVDIPKDMVQKAWKYLNVAYKKYHKDTKKLNAHLYDITLTNYVLSSYPDKSWRGGVFSDKDRKIMLDISFKHWRKLPGLLKAYLALTLKRSGRAQDAKLVFDSIMDSAKTDKDLGTYWAPEDRSWLWYNDKIDSHAFMLRAMMELDPADKRRHGLVQWLMLNKKLNHWKSTRATAESIYSLVHYLKKENQLGQEERALIKIGNLLDKTVVFKPNEYTGKAQLIVEGDAIKPAMSKITVDNQGKSLMFASATWHFSTDRLPKSAQGDFFHVNRKFFKRVQKGKQWVLQPLQEGAQIKIGDQLEIQLSLRAKHAAEFVHLRAPRGAGFEPVSQTSGYRWDTGISYYEEIRDSGANYFFERLPVGEYGFKYRLRATTAGEFRVAPASVQSIYAPEFNAYSSGKRLVIK